MTIIRASDKGTCLIDIFDFNSDLQCATYWYNDNSFNLVDNSNNTYLWVQICADYLYLHNFGENIRNPLNPMFANAFVKEENLVTGLFRCRILACTKEELDNNMISHESHRVGKAIDLFCGDDTTVITESPVISTIVPTLFPSTITTFSPTNMPIIISRDKNVISKQLMYTSVIVFVSIFFIIIYIIRKFRKNSTYKRILT